MADDGGNGSADADDRAMALIERMLALGVVPRSIEIGDGTLRVEVASVRHERPAEGTAPAPRPGSPEWYRSQADAGRDRILAAKGASR
jgi:hypothetical protein